jgi:membrane-bound lytic murein transglycosylase F
VLGQERIVAWAMRRNAPQLKAAIDQWVSSERGRKLLAVLYRKYFVDASGYRERVESKYLTSATGTLSPYDGLFKFYAPRINWDWRLLASQSYQESRFKPTAKSWAGAQGLMQIMPATGREFGVTRLYDPEENIRGGVKYIAWLTKYWEKHISDPGERLKFILASYNTGIGHVEDAQRLALKNGHDSKYWNDVAYWLLQKSKREIYTDPVVKYGFSRGIEPVTYVSLVLERYDHYRQFVVTDSSGQ